MAPTRPLAFEPRTGLCLEIDVQKPASRNMRKHVVVRLSINGATLMTSVALAATPRITDGLGDTRELWIGDLCLKALTPEQLERARTFLEAHGVPVQVDPPEFGTKAVQA